MDGNRPRRPYLKTRHPNWREKLRQNCLERVREERTHLLWKIRAIGRKAPNEKEIVESAFRNIVSDELHKIKQSSFDGCQGVSASKSNDVLWEYDGLHTDSTSNKNECEELMIEMERLLYEDLREEAIRRGEFRGLKFEQELQVYEEEDEYLARAVFEQMQLSDDQVGKNDKVWCPVCKRGELRETHHLIYCSCCELRLDLESDKVNLEFLRDRLGEAHREHLDRGCKVAPKFCMETIFNLTALYIKCEACNTFEIVV